MDPVMIGDGRRRRERKRRELRWPGVVGLVGDHEVVIAFCSRADVDAWRLRAFRR